MDTKIPDIQPVAANAWVPQEAEFPDAQVIPPVAKAESGGNLQLKSDTQALGDVRQPAMSQEKTQAMVDEAQAYLDELNVQVSLSVDPKMGGVVVRVMDRETGEVIRQIPSEDLEALRENLKELRGVLISGTA